MAQQEVTLGQKYLWRRFLIWDFVLRMIASNCPFWLWNTDQQTQEEKIKQLEIILRNARDVGAEYAFDLLYAAGRPKAWDTAEEEKIAPTKKQKLVLMIPWPLNEEFILLKQFQDFEDIETMNMSRVGRVFDKDEEKTRRQEFAISTLPRRILKRALRVLMQKHKMSAKLSAADQKHGGPFCS